MFGHNTQFNNRVVYYNWRYTEKSLYYLPITVIAPTPPAPSNNFSTNQFLMLLGVGT